MFPGRYLALILIAILAVAAACSGDDKRATATPQDSGASTSPGELRPDEVDLLTGPLSADGLQIIFGTPDVSVGENRFGFVLTSPDALIRAPEAMVSSLYFADGDSAGEVRQTASATFRPWPYGTRGLYTTRLNFDRPGNWGIEVSISDEDGSDSTAQLRFEVRQATSAPAVGSPAIKSKSKTINDVDSIDELTTGSLHDPELYQLTIEKAVENGLPSVLVIASPAFCTNAVCGPQVKTLHELKEEYKGQANFVHVDFYDNPHEIQGDLSIARLSPAVTEWMLPSTEWSFVIDREGKVAARFEAYATLEELEQALQPLL